MKRWRFLDPALLGLLGALGAGCGVSQSLYSARLLDLERCRADGRARAAEATRRINELTQERNTLAEKNEESRVKILGLEEQSATLAKDLQASTRDLADLRRAQQLAAERGRAYREVSDYLRTHNVMADGRVSTEEHRGQLLVRIPVEVLFVPPGSEREGGRGPELSARGQMVLREVATALREISDRDYLVVGHTDNTPPPRGFDSNWELSTARAIVVAQFLQASGLDPRHLGAAGRSEFDPIADNGTSAGKNTNRRVEIVILPKPNEVPRAGETPSPGTRAQ